MERESNSMQAMCRSGCGFYGNPSTEGLCSKCFKESLKKKQQPPNPPPSSVMASNPTTSSFLNSAASSIGKASPPRRIHVVTAAELLRENNPDIAMMHRDQEGWIEIKGEMSDLESAICLGGSSGSSSSSSSSSGSSGIDKAESVAESTASSEPDSEKDPPPQKKKRCITCRKKVGLTGFECRCGGLYCSTHRYSDKHSCTFDYRELGAQEIRRNNPVVVGEKIQKI